MHPLYGQKWQQREAFDPALSRPSDITDRAAGIHDVSNIGLFFENRGKLYPRRLTDGPSGEFPINSGRHYIYRCNPMVGVAPDAASGRPANVIQARYTENEEWEAVGGYNNPDYARIAFSDQPISWPLEGWPLADSSGNPLILSDQDSYCVYDDANNTVQVLGIEMHQTGYAYGLNFAEDLLFYRFDIVNTSSTAYDSVYFSMYADIDIGNISGGDPEYGDDLIEFEADNQFLYFYDADEFSAEWGGATGRFGAVMLETPDISGSMAGITDMHYNLYYDDNDNDDLQMAIISSNRDYLPANYDPDLYFHPGTAGSDHFDDPGTISAAGDDILANLSSGPFDLGPSDTLTFILAFVAGTDQEDLTNNLQVARDIYANNFQLPKPPPTPTLTATPGASSAILTWSNTSELTPDPFSGDYDFEGYRLYRSVDRGIHWDQIDRNLNPQTGADPVPIAVFDRLNTLGENTGVQYSYTDTTVVNGFEYWYCLTAFDQGNENLISLESPIGNNTDALNTVSVIPRSNPTGYTPAQLGTYSQIGDGSSNYVLNINPPDDASLNAYNYEMGFTYESRVEVGNSSVEALAVILDSSQVLAHHFGIEFTWDARVEFNLYNLSTDDTVRLGYPYRTGVQYNLENGMKIEFIETDPLFPPEEGDYLTLNFCTWVERISGSDTLAVLTPRPLNLGGTLVTDDGLRLWMTKPDAIQDISLPPNGDLDVEFSIFNEAALLDTDYVILVTGNGIDFSGHPFIQLEIATAGLDSILHADSVYTGTILSFRGIDAQISFDNAYPPEAGTSLTFTSVPPKVPISSICFNLISRLALKLHQQSRAG
jgi:outer membrane lipoprotein-sorting protein